MPLKKGAKNVGKNIAELHSGPRYAANLKKFGKHKADEIAIAAGINASKKKK